MTPPDDLLKRARQIHRTDSREIIEELLAALESDRAHILKLTALLDDSHACSDDCDLVPILAWVDPADKALCAEMVQKDRALLRRIGDALNTWDATAPTVLNAPTSLFVRTVRSIIDEARARIGEGK